jgi:kynurenine 3-monooxygenase
LILWKEVKRLTVPVRGRMMHDREGKTSYQSYSKDDSEFNYSISRKGLNELLLNRAEKEGVQIFFNQALNHIDFENRVAFFNEKDQVEFHQLFGADGSNSQVRKELMNFLSQKDIQYKNEMEDLGVSYKELYLPPNKDGKFKIEPTALHIWPRGKLFSHGTA